MSNLKITKAQHHLIEKLGVIYERAGMQPAAARITALLMVSDRIELTFDEIKQTLNISKSAVSMAINLLLSMNKIEYITKPGDRKRYFKSKLMNWKEEIKQGMERITNKNCLLKEILSQRPKSTKEFNATLAEIIDFMEFFQKEGPAIFKKWEASKK